MQPAHILAVLLLSAASQCFAAQPNMEAALASLQQAKESLQKATADKGGHRGKALKAINLAIGEVTAGIEFARTHLSKGE